MAETCMDLVRLHDRDRYIATLFAPDEKREHLFALYAFAIELARIPNLVSEPSIGEIRLQWWADTVQSIAAGQAVDHPVAQAFAAALHRYELPVKHIGNMIDARRSDLYADQFASLLDLEGYLAETEAAVMQFACMVLDRETAAHASGVVGSAATAFGLSRLLQKGDVKLLPPGKSLEDLKNLVRKRLAEARLELVPPALLPAVLPACLTDLYLRGTHSALRRQWTMWRAARSGRL
jgi:15-cis-phytoene synthase